MAITSYERDGLTFDVRDDGPSDGSPVVLLHGWPGGAATWDAVVPELRRAGLRTLVPDQRGYSPGARPHGRRPYAVGELVADVGALLDAVGCERAHVVGHDWGGAVAWHLGAEVPERVASLTVLSTPHPRAMAEAVVASDQALRSAYVAAFQVPVAPERLLLARGGALLRRALRGSGLRAEVADAYVERQSEPGALRASLAWYRALPFSRPAGQVTVPTTFVWGEHDTALGPSAAHRTRRHVTGPYRFEAVAGATHWLPEHHPELVASHVEAQVRAVDEP